MIYLSDLKRKKLFFKMTVFDLVFLGCLVALFIIYSSKIVSIKPLIFPASYFVLKFRFLEGDQNLWNYISRIFDFLINSQQTFYWESDE
jgi:hypothetical protein